MSETNTKGCRCCLKVIEDNKFDIMGELTIQMFNKLLKLNLDTDKETVICLVCATKLQSAVDFKTTCLIARSNVSLLGNLENDLKPLSKEENHKQNTGIGFSDISSDQKVCQFCLSLTERGRCVDLQDTKEYVFMVDTVQKHIPELHLNDAKELVTCDNCLSSLQNFSNFIIRFSKTERFREINRKTSGGQFDLGDNSRQRTENVAGRRSDKYNNNIEHITVKNEPGCKDSVEIDNLNVDITSIDVNVKLEQDDCERPDANNSSLSLKSPIRILSDQIAAAGPSETWSWELYNEVQSYRPPHQCETRPWTFRVRPSFARWFWVKVWPRQFKPRATNKKNSDLVALERTICATPTEDDISETASTRPNSPMDMSVGGDTTPPHDQETFVSGSPIQDKCATDQLLDPVVSKDLRVASELGDRLLDNSLDSGTAPLYECSVQDSCHFPIKEEHASAQFPDSVAKAGVVSQLGDSLVLPSLQEVTSVYLPVKQRKLCWRCGCPGHSRGRCNGKRRLFCSKCGLIGIMSKDCKCQAKNRSSARRTQSPLQRSRSPLRRFRSPLRRFRSPLRRTRSPLQQSRSPSRSRRLQRNNSRSQTMDYPDVHDLRPIRSVCDTSGSQLPTNAHRSMSSIGTQCYLYPAPPQIDTTSRGTQCELIWNYPKDMSVGGDTTPPHDHETFMPGSPIQENVLLTSY